MYAMTTNRTNRWLTWIALCVMLPASGCTRYLVATPNLLRGCDPSIAFESCPTECQSPDAPVVYATDRANEAEPGEPPNFGHKRGNNLTFGIATVNLKSQASWKQPIQFSTSPWAELIHDSTSADRNRDYALKLTGVQDFGRLKPMIGPTPAGELILAKSQADEEHERPFHNLLRSRLAQTAHKDVYIFIHGYNNTFADGVFRAAEVWHFMGRGGVPVAYTWPAGWGGIRGYAYDRESGEFTVTHLRRFIKKIAECPDVERIHLIAHSRGADVTITALRELHIGYRAQGKSTQQELKLENLVLAAPDLDEEVFMQRFVGENMLQAANRTTIYASARDKAIELSDIMFASRRRLGMLVAKDFNPKLKRVLAKMPNVQFIECKLSGSYLSHDYLFTHPAAFSDLILLLRDRRPPGAEYGRPLRQPAEGIWELTDDYLAKR